MNIFWFLICVYWVFTLSFLIKESIKGLKYLFKFLKNYPWFKKLQNQDLLIFALKLYIANILAKLIISSLQIK